MDTPLTGVVLLNMGGPDSLAAVEPFLFNLFRDNDILPLPLGGLVVQRPLARWIAGRRASIVRGHYARIGGRSPIAKITARQAQLLERRLARAHGDRFRCYVAMRYWHPLTDEAIGRMAQDGVARVVALPLYPHYTTATTLSSLRELGRGLRAAGGQLARAEVLAVDRWFDEPAYLDALAHRIDFGLRRFPAAGDHAPQEVTVLFSAHGLPLSFIRKGDPYVDHLHATITGVIARLALRRRHVYPWRLSFQSRAGTGRWLEPSTDQMLGTLASEGRRDVLAVPISFVSDHIETLYEIDMLLGDRARALGLRMRRAPSLNLEHRLTEALATLVERRCGLLAPDPHRLLPAASM